MTLRNELTIDTVLQLTCLFEMEGAFSRCIQPPVDRSHDSFSPPRNNATESKVYCGTHNRSTLCVINWSFCWQERSRVYINARPRKIVSANRPAVFARSDLNRNRRIPNSIMKNQQFQILNEPRSSGLQRRAIDHRQRGRLLFLKASERQSAVFVSDINKLCT